MQHWRVICFFDLEKLQKRKNCYALRQRVKKYWKEKSSLYKNTWRPNHDKSLTRPTSRCILFDDENILFDASLDLYIYIYI